MRRAIRWAIVLVCSCGTGFGLAVVKDLNENLDFFVWLTGVLAIGLLVAAFLAWVLLEDDEEEEEEDVE